MILDETNITLVWTLRNQTESKAHLTTNFTPCDFWDNVMSGLDLNYWIHFACVYLKEINNVVEDVRDWPWPVLDSLLHKSEWNIIQIRCDNGMWYKGDIWWKESVTPHKRPQLII